MTSTEPSIPTTESSPATNGPSHLFSLPTSTTGRPATVSPDTGSAKSTEPASSSDDSSATKSDPSAKCAELTPSAPKELKPRSPLQGMFRYRHIVDPFDRDVARAISEAIQQVAIPAAEYMEGKKISPADYEEHGLREQRLTKSWPQSVEFFWRHQTVALLVVSMEGQRVCVEAESGTTFGE